MADQFHLAAGTALTVIVATVVMYLALVVLVALTGRSTLAARTPIELGCVAAIGAVVGRTALLTDPSIAIGLVALVTFFATQRLLRLARRVPAWDRLVNDGPVVLVRDGQLLPASLARTRVSEHDLRQALRLAGHHGLGRVGLVVLERNGALSVLDDSAEPDAWACEDLES